MELVVVLLRHSLGVHQTLIALSDHTLHTQSSTILALPCICRAYPDYFSYLKVWAPTEK